MTVRGGRIRAFQVPDRQTHTVINAMTKNVSKEAHVMTDDAGVYRKLIKVGYNNHGTIKHSRRQYVLGDIHTNSIESFWALFKRGYHGTYHTMSKKHLQRYIDEFCFRFNSRNTTMQEMFADVTHRLAKSGKMPLKKLTAYVDR